MTRRALKDKFAPNVTRVAVESRPLTTIRGDEAKDQTFPPGTLVRYYPSAGQSSLEVENTVRALKAAGALVVRVQPAEGETPILSNEDSAADGFPGNRSLDIRGAVTTVAGRIRNVDPGALGRRLDDVLSKVDL